MSDLTPWERLRAAQLVEGDAPGMNSPIGRAVFCSAWWAG